MTWTIKSDWRLQFVPYMEFTHPEFEDAYLHACTLTMLHNVERIELWSPENQIAALWNKSDNLWQNIDKHLPKNFATERTAQVTTGYKIYRKRGLIQGV